MARLYELKNIVGVKDATGDLDRVDQQLKSMGKNFIQLTGEDNNALEFNKRGGVGCISVTANIAAKLCSEFQKACTDKDDLALTDRAKQLNNMLSPLHKALFIESNPSPVKYAASLLNLSSADVRLPLVQLLDSSKKEVMNALKVTNLL